MKKLGLALGAGGSRGVAHIGFLKALEEEGLNCPKDVSVTGYDNSYLASECKVLLTTIAHPQQELGSMAARLLLEMIEDENYQQNYRQIVIEPELIIRDSCRKIN